MEKEIDNFSLQCYRNCPKSFYWRIERGLVKPSEPQVAADFGTAIHKALEVYYSAGMTEESKAKAIDAFITSYKDPPEEKKRTALKGVDLLTQYFDHYGVEPFSVIATEVGGAFELGDGWIYKTRLDLIVEWEEPRGIYVIDHKTASDIKRIVVKPNNQLTGYIANLLELYENVYGAILNVIGVYESDEVVDRDSPKVISEKTGKLVYAKRKRQVFTRPVTTRTPAEIESWRKETLWLLRQIERSREEGIWPSYTSFCSAYRGRCWYLDLCNAPSEEVVERMIEVGIYEVKPWEPYNEEKED